MRKFLFTMLLCCISTTMYGQLNYPVGVCGVSFGATYEYVSKMLENKYGEKSLSSNQLRIVYYDFPLINLVFHSATFCFQKDKEGNNRFNEAYFSIHYDLDEQNKSKDCINYIANLLKKKYSDLTEISDDKSVTYVCGLNEKEAKYRILLSLSKDKSKGGDTFYYVTLSYFGPDYINIIDDL